MRVRNKAACTRFTEEEWEKVKQLQEQSGLKGERFRRCAILGVQIKEAPPDELPEFIRLLRRLNANADQILRQMNAGGITDVLAIKKLKEDIYNFEEKVIMALITDEDG